MNKADRKSLFVTGAGGFVGRRLIEHLSSTNVGHIYGLCRKKNAFLESLAAGRQNLTVIYADLFDVARYRDALDNCDIAIHLAATTGKASSETYFHINADGTALFIEQCKQAKIGKFLHFSTIAVNFDDISGYPYARSKQKAEQFVAASGLQYAIVRPTIVFGCQSPIWNNFLTMARAPVPFVFGNGRTRIQPIHVDDLVAAVATIIERDHFCSKAWDLGGNQIVTIEELIRRIRQPITGKPVRRLARIPLSPLSKFLDILEPVALGLLPFTAGQLTSFKCDGIAGSNLLMETARSQLMPFDKMINLLLQECGDDAADAGLSREARRLGTRITGKVPPEMVIQKYVQAHRKGLVTSDRKAGWFDRIVIGAAKNRILFYLVEAYSAVLHRNGLLRKKMVLLTAILECLPETQASSDIPESGHLIGFLCGLLFRTLVFVFALLISIPILLPLHLLTKPSDKHPVEEVS